MKLINNKHHIGNLYNIYARKRIPSGLTIKEPQFDVPLKNKVLDVVNKVNSQESAYTSNELKFMQQEIRKKINTIFCRSEIASCKSREDLAFELFKYIVYNSKYDEHIMVEKSLCKSLREMEIKDIYHCLCEGRSVCTSDATSLNLLFRLSGIKSRHITIADKGETPSSIHEVVEFVLNGDLYICDPTLVRTALETGQIPDINKNVFAFNPYKFFTFLYPNYEVKYRHSDVELEK